jgi:hypothetical protein
LWLQVEVRGNESVLYQSMLHARNSQTYSMRAKTSAYGGIFHARRGDTAISGKPWKVIVLVPGKNNGRYLMARLFIIGYQSVLTGTDTSRDRRTDLWRLFQLTQTLAIAFRLSLQFMVEIREPLTMSACWSEELNDRDYRKQGGQASSRAG